MEQFPDMILTIIVLSFWFLFPIGIFLSVSHIDKNTDQIIRLGHLRHHPVSKASSKESPEPSYERPVGKKKTYPKHKWQVSYRH